MQSMPWRMDDIKKRVYRNGEWRETFMEGGSTHSKSEGM
jgi:hypothetical protein